MSYLYHVCIYIMNVFIYILDINKTNKLIEKTHYNIIVLKKTIEMISKQRSLR